MTEPHPRTTGEPLSDATFETSLRFTLQPTPTAAAEVRAQLRVLSRGTPFAARIDDAELAATELVTNAVLHGREPIVVRLTLDAERLRVEVQDASPVSPTFSLLDPTAVTGRGLLLVSSLADRWGVEPQADGKSVWIELSTTVPVASEEADIEALLASWGDELGTDPAEECVRVVLTDLDVQLVAQSETHLEGVLRELALVASSEAADPRVQQTAAQVLHAAERFDAGRTELRRQIAGALAHRSTMTDVELTITRADAELVRDYSHALDVADRLCRSGVLLTEAASDALLEVRRGYLRRILAQLGS